MTEDSGVTGRPADSLKAGVSIGFFLILLSQIPAVFVGLMWALFFGVTQLVGIVPAAIYMFVKGYLESLKGLMLIAGIAFLLNSICTVVVMATLEIH